MLCKHSVQAKEMVGREILGTDFLGGGRTRVVRLGARIGRAADGPEHHPSDSSVWACSSSGLQQWACLSGDAAAPIRQRRRTDSVDPELTPLVGQKEAFPSFSSDASSSRRVLTRVRASWCFPGACKSERTRAALDVVRDGDAGARASRHPFRTGRASTPCDTPIGPPD